MQKICEYGSVQSELIEIVRHIYCDEIERFNTVQVFSEWQGEQSTAVRVYEWKDTEGKLKILLRGDSDNRYRNFRIAKFEVIDTDGAASMSINSEPHKEPLEADPFNQFILSAFKSYIEQKQSQQLELTGKTHYAG